MRIRDRFSPGTTFLAAFAMVLLVFSLLPARSSAQGIASEGREFYVGYMPPLQDRQITRYFALVGSSVDQTVTISYFNEDGTERVGKSEVIPALSVKKIELDRFAMRPLKPGEKLEFKAARITSRYPISVQCYNEGTLSGGMLLSIPTNALGKHYVVSAWNDQPTIPAGLQSGWGGQNLRDSSSSMFMIIAAHDKTTVTLTTNSTTFGGQVGVNSGYGAQGKKSPRTFQMKRGQVYWVLSNPGEPDFDLSNSVITADKPIAVIAGQEKALIGDPSGIWHYMDNDFRDLMLEQMIPVESWSSGGYVSIPFEPPLLKSTRMLKNGEGDLYRMYTPKQSGAALFFQGGRTDPYTYQLAEYQSPAAQRENVIEDAVDIYERDANKMYVVMYDYFQGIHDRDPGEGAGDGGKGDTKQESTNYTTPNEMNVIPMNRWRKTALFMVPVNSLYRNGQFFNIITHRDSLDKIKVKFNGTNEKPLSALPARRRFTIPHYPDLVGIRYQVAGGVYYIYGNTPFACYSYGRTEGWYKDDFGYAAPVAGAYGSFDEEQNPLIQITPGCSWWDVKITDSRMGDKGLNDVMLLNDPNAQMWQPAKVSQNVRMTPENPTILPGDSVLQVKISVANPFLDAYAALYVVDAAGNDTVYEFTYRAPSFTATPLEIDFGVLDIGTERCSTFTFKNTAAAGGIPVNVSDIQLLFKNQGITITNISPSLPRSLNGGESVTVTVCYKATDALVEHIDSLILKTDCFEASLPIKGEGAAPNIYAYDIDFGEIAVGSTKCENLIVENRGTAPFTLTKDWILHKVSSTEFSFEDDAKLPLVLKPGEKVTMRFCYSPTNLGFDSTHQDWGNNIPPPFTNKEKAWSYLKGSAKAPEVVWDRPIEFFDVVCEEADTQRVYFTNILNAQETVTDIKIIDDPYNEFSFGGNEHSWPIPVDGRPVDPGDSIWIDVVFKADLSKGYATRFAKAVIIGLLGPDDTLRLSGTVDYADLKASVTDVNFGAEVKDTKIQRTIRYTNPGTSELIVRTVDVMPSNTFTVVSGIGVGTRIPAGDYVDVVVEGTAPEQGEITGQLVVNGETSCPPEITIPLTIAGYFPTAQGTGYAAPLTFVCKDNSGEIEFRNGVVPVRLDRVEIVDIPGSTYADQYQFANGTRTLIVNKMVDGNGVERFPVTFKPTVTNGVGAPARVLYYWSHPTSGMTGIAENSLNGTATVLANTLSVAKNTANEAYSAQTMDRFAIDVKMLDDIIAQGNIKKIKFGVSFRQDLFRFLTFDAAGGLSATKTDPPASNDQNDIVWIEVSGDLTTQDVLGTLQFQLLVARDIESPFEIITPVAYAADGSEACYMSVANINAAFTPQDLCGDKVLREYLNDRLPTSLIEMSPNPAADQIKLTYDVGANDLPVTIEVFDVLGQSVQTVMNAKPHQLGRHFETIDASTLPSGTYTVRIVGGGRVTSHQVKVEH
jgi:hypothetical protein